MVVETAGAIVAAVARCPNRVHPRRDSAWLHLPGTSEVSRPPTPKALSRGTASWRAEPSSAGVAALQALRRAGDLPLSLKAHPRTTEHATITAAGGAIYQQCPPELVPTGTPELADWCGAWHADAVRSGVHLVPGRERTQTEVADAWTSLYEVVHAEWSPTAPTASLLEIFEPMIKAELDPDDTVLALVDGEIVAGCFVFLGPDPTVEAVAEALVPEHPQARAAVAACPASVLARVDGRPVEFDGHRSDPHFLPLLESLPGVQAGATPLDLLEL